MNPLKLFKDTVPQLSKVLESIHAYLEEQLKTQNLMLEKLESFSASTASILEELKKLNDKGKDN